MTENRAPASPFDVFNVYFASIYDPTMHILFVLDGEIDEERLQKAVMLALEANPYLSSRYTEDGGKAFWERIPAERWIESFEMVKLKEGGETPPAIPPCSIDIHKETSFRVMLFRKEGSADMIAFSLHHGCADAKGLMDAASLVISIYRNLLKDHGFMPENMGWYSRDPKWILARFPEKDLREAAAKENRIIDRWAFPYEYRGRGEPRIATRRFPEDRLKKIKGYCRKNDVTVNDVLIAANLMAMLKIRNDPSDTDSIRGILTSADMRRHLAPVNGHSVENLSVAYMVEICTTGADDFETVLKRVAAITREQKSGNLGLGDIIFYEETYEKGLSAVNDFFREIHAGYDTSSLKNPVFSNLGIIDEISFEPGEGKKGSRVSVTDAIFLPVICWPLGFLLTASTWKGSLRLACGYEEGPYSGTTIGKFFDLIDEYLP